MVVLQARGFSASGVREITEAAEAPLGSLANHFGSKEAFGWVVLNRHFERLSAVMDSLPSDGRLAPLERIDAYVVAMGRLALPVR